MLLTCEDIRDLLDAYLDGELCAEDETALRAHLSVCASCREELEELKAMRAALPLTHEEYPENLHEGIMAALSAATAGESKKTRRRVGLWATRIAASLLILVLALPLMYRWIPVKNEEKNAQLQPLSVDARIAGSVLLYPVGANVWESRSEGFATEYRLCYRGEIAVLTIDGKLYTGEVEFAEDGVAFLCLCNRQIYRLIAVEGGAYLLISED